MADECCVFAGRQVSGEGCSASDVAHLNVCIHRVDLEGDAPWQRRQRERQHLIASRANGLGFRQVVVAGRCAGHFVFPLAQEEGLAQLE